MKDGNETKTVYTWRCKYDKTNETHAQLAYNDSEFNTKSVKLYLKLNVGL